MPDKDTGSGSKRKFAEASCHSTPPAPSVNPGDDNSNVGNKLLKMMGWKEGSGLGSEGEGRLNPVCVFPMLCLYLVLTLLVRETAVYTPGAGLGASKGKDIGKYAEGFSSYVHMVQDAVSTPRFSSESKLNQSKARERYGN